MPLRFPTTRDGWRFDIVSLLAVIGESSMSRHVQPLTASRLCLLPRLLPAPQALLKPSRPSSLPSHNAMVVGIYSGIMVTQLNYFANLLHPVAELTPHTVREINITHKRPFNLGSSFRILGPVPGEISPKRASPLNVLTGFSTLLTLGLLIWTIIIEDGVAFVAILIVSVTSSIVGLASCWQPHLSKRAKTSRVPPGDVVIRSRNGAFLIIHCSEEIARELYIGAEECSYWVGDRPFQVLMGVGTLLLMIAVALLSNCTWVMQLVLGMSYIILNALYWGAALLPPRWHWSLDRYDMMFKPQIKSESYTEALWQAIKVSSRDETGHKREGRYKTTWVEISTAAPKTPAWNNWLREAEESVNIGNDGWDAIASWQKLQKEEEVRIEVGTAGIVPQSTKGTVGDFLLDPRR